MSRCSYKTELNDRVLWYDGDSSFNSTNVLSHLKRGHDIKYVDIITSEIEKYNKLASNPFAIKESCDKLDKKWILPKFYQELDAMEYIINLHDRYYNEYNDFMKRKKRLLTELLLFQQLEWVEVLQTIIYVINRLEEQGIVWGVGRGSSVSSYVLYVIGVHDIDSYEYDLDIEDFLHN